MKEQDALYTAALSRMGEEQGLIDLKMSASTNTAYVTITTKGIQYYEDMRQRNNRVFIVHGHDEAKKWELKNLLQRFRLDPIILHEQDSMGLTLIEKFEHYARICAAALVLLTPDDHVPATTRDESEAQWRARQNVIMEMGYFMGLLGRRYVVVICRGHVEIPSDISGVIYLPFKDSVDEVSEPLRNRLTGIEVME